MSRWISIVVWIVMAVYADCLSLCAQVSSDIAQGYYDQSYQISRYDFDQCLSFADSGYQVSLELEDEVLRDWSLYYEGICYNRHGQYEDALRCFDSVYTLFSVRGDTMRMADIIYQSALVHRQRTEHLLFINKINQAYDLASAISYQSKIGMSLNAKLIHYSERERWAEGEEAGLRALRIFETLKDSSSMGDVLNNLGNLKTRMGQLDEALPFHQRQHLINQKVNNVWGLGYSHSKLGGIYLTQGDLSRADYHLNAALEIVKQQKTPYEYAGALRKNAERYLKTKNYQRALEMAEESERITKEHQQGAGIVSSLELLSRIHEARGNVTKALAMQKEYAKVRHSTLNENIAKQLDEIETKYQTEKKESEIERLSLVDQLNQTKISRQRIALGGSAVALGLLSLLLYRLFGQNKKITDQNLIITKANQEKEVLLKEIHHRVKNNLQVISSLLGLQSLSIKDQKAKDAIQEGRSRVHSMSLIHQHLYKKDNLTGIEMTPYIKKLCRDLIQTYHVGDTEVTFYEEVQSGLILDVETVVPLGLIINELITNSLKYAFVGREKGLITVTLHDDGDHLLLGVADNGVGLAPEILQNGSDSFGHSLIRAFRDKLDAELQIQSEKGVHVQLKIKNYKVG